MSAADRQKWDAKYADAAGAPREPSAVLVKLAEYIPKHGRALDIAGGAGRNALWLAQRGLDVTIADISPVGLTVARRRAAEQGLVLHTIEIDLEQQPLNVPPFDLILSVCYLSRPLFAEFPRLLNPGGILVIIQPTKRNLERNDKSPAPYLLEEGELPRLLPLPLGEGGRRPGEGLPARSVNAGRNVGVLEIIRYEEGWLADGRHDAVLMAKKCS